MSRETPIEERDSPHVDAARMEALRSAAFDGVLVPTIQPSFLEPSAHGVTDAPESRVLLASAQQDIAAAYMDCAIWAQQHMASAEDPRAPLPSEEETGQMLRVLGQVQALYGKAVGAQTSARMKHVLHEAGDLAAQYAPASEMAAHDATKAPPPASKGMKLS